MDWKWLLFSFDGRINRAQFWLGALILIAVSLVAYFVVGWSFGGVFYDDTGAPHISSTVWVLMLVVWLVTLYASFAVYAKRWHDRDKSGWWTLIGFVPIIGGIWLLVECGCLQGTEGQNRFGTDPLAG